MYWPRHSTILVTAGRVARCRSLVSDARVRLASKCCTSCAWWFDIRNQRPSWRTEAHSVATPYRLPNAMIELVLREQGWQASSLGTSLPAATIGEAVRDSCLRLLWLSVSYIGPVPTFLEEYAHLHRAAIENGAAVVVGGRALTPEIRQQMAYSAYCDTLRHLLTFAASLNSIGAERRTGKSSHAASCRLESMERLNCSAADQDTQCCLSILDSRLRWQ
jgi:hypothetical protein